MDRGAWQATVHELTESDMTERQRERESEKVPGLKI